MYRHRPAFRRQVSPHPGRKRPDIVRCFSPPAPRAPGDIVLNGLDTSSRFAAASMRRANVSRVVEIRLR